VYKKSRKSEALLKNNRNCFPKTRAQRSTRTIRVTQVKSGAKRNAISGKFQIKIFK